MARLTAGLTAIALGLCAPVASAQPTLPAQILEAAAVGEDVVFVRGGALVATNRNTGAERTLLVEGVTDIFKDQDRILVATTDRKLRDRGPATAQLLSYASGRLTPLATLPLAAEEWPGVMFALDGEPAFVGQRNLRAWSRGAWRDTRLNDDVRGGAVAVTGDRRSLYVGLNSGEWGGGMVRIDIATGDVTRIEKVEDAKEICGYPLDTECDPVTAIVADPERPGCVYAAIGLQHMLAHGHVLRVCGKEIEVVFERPIKDAWAPMTEAVYGLGVSGKDIIAVTSRGFYRVGANESQIIEMPTPVERGGLRIAEGPPGFLIVSTMANQRHSLSGPTPLLVPLD